MAEFPKRWVKGDSVRTSHNVRQDVQFQFAGYKQAAMDVTPTQDDPPESHVQRVNALLGRDDDTVKAPPELTENEMAKLPEAKDAEVVDTTDDAPKPKGFPRRDTESNTAPRN